MRARGASAPLWRGAVVTTLCCSAAAFVAPAVHAAGSSSAAAMFVHAGPGARAGRSAQHLSWTAERRARLSPHRVFAAAAGARRSPHAPRKEVPSSTRVDPLPQSRPPPRILRNQRNSLVARSAPAFRGERAPSHALVNVRRHVTSRRGFSTFSVGACFSRFAHTRPLPCFTVWLCTGGGGQGPSGESRRWRSRGERLAGVVS